MDAYSGKRQHGDDTMMASGGDANWQGPPRKRRDYEPLPPNHVLLLTILNPLYPITVEVLHAICSPHSRVVRIVTFQKTGMQAMIELESVAGACAVREAVDGADIYSGCCTVRAEFAKPTRLNVFRNDSRTFDYTVDLNNPAEAEKAQQMRKTPLLPQPGNNYGGGAASSVPPPPMDQPPYPDMRGPAGGPGGPMSMGGDMFPSQRSNGGGGGGGSGGNFAVSAGIFRAAQEYSRSGCYGQEGGMYTMTMREDRRAPVMAQPGTVVMVYGLSADKTNPTRLFNLFCLYGNVARIKFLRSKEGTAMIQMEDMMSVDRIMQNLNRAECFGGHMQLTPSKQPYLNEVADPQTLPDGSSCFGDFTRDRNNRYLDQKTASRNRVIAPTHILHYYNAPPSLSVEEVTDMFTSNGAEQPLEVRIFPARSSRSSSGLVQFGTVAQAVEALMVCNHVPMPHADGGQPYTVKLCFSSSRSLDAASAHDASAAGGGGAAAHFQ